MPVGASPHDVPMPVPGTWHQATCSSQRHLPKVPTTSLRDETLLCVHWQDEISATTSKTDLQPPEGGFPFFFFFPLPESFSETQPHKSHLPNPSGSPVSASSPSSFFFPPLPGTGRQARARGGRQEPGPRVPAVPGACCDPGDIEQCHQASASCWGVSQWGQRGREGLSWIFL